MLETLKLAIVDVETTGGSAAFDRIIEIGIKRIEGGETVRSLSTLLDPERPIPPMIQQLTGIGDQDVAGAPTFRQVQTKLRDLLEGCLFVAHNARFDYGFIRNEFLRHGETFSATCLCTVRLSRLLYPKYRQHNLDSLIARFGFSCERRHRALDDAAVLWEFFQHARRSVDEAILRDAIARLIKSPTLPPNLSPEDLDALPAGPGVYVFFDATGMPLYVGKSVAVRDRVRSHFSSDYRSGKEMRICQETARIETRATYGKLGALLLESHLIKTLSPLRNRMARLTRTLVVIWQAPPRDGYDRVAIEPLTPATLDDAARILAIFRSRRQAKEFLYEAAQEQRLCPRLLGLERASTDGPCVYRQMRQCAGGCVGDDPPAHYNARLSSVFVERRIKTWPYPGPVLIEERSPDRTRGHIFVIDQWRLLHTLAYAEDGRSPFLDAQRCFDYDIYKILARHLLRDRRGVRPLRPDEADQLLTQLDPACA